MLRRLVRSVLFILVTLFSSWALFFFVIEVFPDLLNRLPLGGNHYYALKQRYVTHPELVFVYRRTDPVARWSFTGDLHRYGIPVKPIEYVATYDTHGFRKNSSGPPYDVAVIGDSYIEIGETDDVTFAEMLKGEVGLSRAWYGSQQYLELFKCYAVPARPRYVIFCFFAGNVFNDITEYERWKAEGRYYFYRRSILARFLLASKEIFGFLVRKTMFFQGQTPITPDPYTFGIIDAGGQKVSMAFAYWEREVTGQQVAALKAVLNEVKAVSEDQRIIPILVYVPTATHVHAGRYSAESSPEFIARVKSLQGNPSLEALSPIAKELGIELINLLPGLPGRSQARTSALLPIRHALER